MAIGTLLPGKDGLPKAKDLSYFSRMTDHQTFGRLATLETYRRATDKAAKVTAVVDGADWIQEFLDLQCQRAVRVIDWGHSSAYITRASQACFTDVGQAADWRGSQLNELLHGDPQEVLIELCQKLTACTVGSDQESRGEHQPRLSRSEVGPGTIPRLPPRWPPNRQRYRRKRQQGRR